MTISAINIPGKYLDQSFMTSIMADSATWKCPLLKFYYCQIPYLDQWFDILAWANIKDFAFLTS